MALRFQSDRPVSERGFAERFVDLFQPREDERGFGQKVRHLFSPPQPEPQPQERPEPTPDPFIEKGWVKVGENDYIGPELAKQRGIDVKDAMPEPEVKGMATPTPMPTKQPEPTPTPVNVKGRDLGRNPNVDRFKISDRVYSAINSAASMFDIPAALLHDIALKESSFDPSLVNETPEGKAAGNPTGLFQFTDATWDDVLAFHNDPDSSLYKKLPNTNRKDPRTNAIAAAYLIKFGQLGKWDASKYDEKNPESAWGRYWPDEELRRNGFYEQTLSYKG